MAVRLIALLVTLSLAACGTDDSSAPTEPAAHSEASDLEVVPDKDSKGDDVLPRFDRNTIVSDTFYQDDGAVTAEDLQAFFENSPYGNRSWLADLEIDGKTAAQIVVEAGQHHHINPLMILVRLQVEQGLVSKTVRPSQRRIDRALGCGCPDGQSCYSNMLGFLNQMECGGETHRKLFDQSFDRANVEWLAGRTRRSLDGYSVTPSNHASAALYAYTPWVLPNRGGNWLVWNVARKFVRHLEEMGAYHPRVEPFVGTPCADDGDCEFYTTDGDAGFCRKFADINGNAQGFCSLVCDGYCPDKSGRAPTFCVADENSGLGTCASKSHDLNEQCSSIPGTRIEERDRYVDESGASASTATVCVPDTF